MTSRQPHVYRDGPTLHLAILPSYRKQHRHRRSAPIFDDHLERITDRGDCVDRLIQLPGLEEPSLPEPGEVLAGHIFEGMKEVVGRWVLVTPAPDVLGECLVERLGTEHGAESRQ